MSTGGTVDELAAEVDALVGALVLHRQVVQDAEQRTVAGADVALWSSIAAVHREIVAEYIEEIRLLRAEIRLLPAQRRSS